MDAIPEVDYWKAELESVFARVAGRFARADLRRRMRDYVRGLLGRAACKNGWQLAEWAGHRTPDGFQRLLNSSVWDADALRDDVRAYVGESLGPGGVLIIDDTGFVKKGTASAGVGRQYTGTSGKIDNCQIGVFAAYATRSGRALVDRKLYLPKAWTSDRERCRAAKIPDNREFAAKGDLAKTMIQRALASPLPIAWVTADSAYGQEWRLRRMLEEAGVGYVLAVPKSQSVPALGRIDLVIAQAPDEAWERHSCGDGAKGPRVYDWAAAKLPANIVFDPDPPTHHRWVLARRSLSDPGEIAYYLAYAPVGTEVPELARIAGSRWAIEECFQAAKNECGLDEYEVRRCPGWYRHITLVMLAHAFLAAMSATATVARGAAETVPVPSRPSLWQKSGGSWQFTVPHRHPGGKPIKR
ncbi:IS701 family transposase [Streptomyces hirsutus]|uniref:IS701 family transposase n=1 Tax=Streptomyces hirsutus TaxID=35620 RepID=A0ABZ1H1S2_9ACTN|nr:IS701 family transposase [Streptomyces hirsutus]WSD11048.1 IS701 family transposase [Streptomyces hirsutus]